jgi:hypothetical protein
MPIRLIDDQLNLNTSCQAQRSRTGVLGGREDPLLALAI